MGRSKKEMIDDPDPVRSVLRQTIKMVDLSISNIRNLDPKVAISRLEQVLDMLDALVDDMPQRS